MKNNSLRIDFIIESALLKIREVQALRFHNQNIDFECAYIEAVMWIAVGTEWFEQQHRNVLYKQGYRKKLNNSKKEKSILTTEYYYLLGVKQIFNSFKHNMQITSFDNIQYRKTAFDKYIQTVVWLDAKQMNKVSSIQYQSYREHFEKQPIIPTLIKAVIYLEVLHSRSLEKNLIVKPQ